MGNNNNMKLYLVNILVSIQYFLIIYIWMKNFLFFYFAQSKQSVFIADYIYHYSVGVSPFIYFYKYISFLTVENI